MERSPSPEGIPTFFKTGEGGFLHDSTLRKRNWAPPGIPPNGMPRGPPEPAGRATLAVNGRAKSPALPLTIAKDQ
jgi:hypothetical protein